MYLLLLFLQPQPPKLNQTPPTPIQPQSLRPPGPNPVPSNQPQNQHQQQHSSQQQQQQQQQQPQVQPPTKQNRVTTLPKPVGIDPLIILQERENRYVYNMYVVMYVYIRKFRKASHNILEIQ